LLVLLKRIWVSKDTGDLLRSGSKSYCLSGGTKNANTEF
jgi:hypothetical protein